MTKKFIYFVVFFFLLIVLIFIIVLICLRKGCILDSSCNDLVTVRSRKNLNGNYAYMNEVLDGPSGLIVLKNKIDEFSKFKFIKLSNGNYNIYTRMKKMTLPFLLLPVLILLLFPVQLKVLFQIL